MCVSICVCVTSSWERLPFSSSFFDLFRASGPTTDKMFLNLREREGDRGREEREIEGRNGKERGEKEGREGGREERG